MDSSKNAPRATTTWLGSRANLIAIAVGLGLVGLIVVRAATTSSTGSPPASVADAGASAAPRSSAYPPQVFDTEQVGPARAGIPIRQMDKDIFAEITAATMERERMKDVFPERPYRVQLIGSLAERRIGFVLIDLDRDGKNDERWEIRTGEVARMVPQDPAANGRPVKYTLRNGRWQPH